jgi:hypothetical protein
VLCAVTLKSTKEIQEIPLIWKMGIDIQKVIHTGQTRNKTLEQNYGEGNECMGGPKWTYNNKEIPCFVGCSPKTLITSKMLAEML